MRDLKNITNADAMKAGWDILVPCDMEVVAKAVLEDAHGGINLMKSTKRFRVPGGWIYNTSTELHRANKVAVAEALVFVPEAQKAGP